MGIEFTDLNLGSYTSLLFLKHYTNLAENKSPREGRKL